MKCFRQKGTKSRGILHLPAYLQDVPAGHPHGGVASCFPEREDTEFCCGCGSKHPRPPTKKNNEQTQREPNLIDLATQNTTCKAKDPHN